MSSEQMPSPQWVMSFGAGTSSGDPDDDHAVVQGIDTIIPVDVYVLGCLPHPHAALDRLLKWQECGR